MPTGPSGVNGERRHRGTEGTEDGISFGSASARGYRSIVRQRKTTPQRHSAARAATKRTTDDGEPTDRELKFEVDTASLPK